ncbi:hypothetical protein QJS66_10420 [Kocuria rhizophila]|nr:hypothetical protein QJS66_10420 [Kocuria rhizophila]
MQEQTRRTPRCCSWCRPSPCSRRRFTEWKRGTPPRSPRVRGVLGREGGKSTADDISATDLALPATTSAST